MGNSPFAIIHCSLVFLMPTVFASVSVTILLFYITTLILAYFHILPVSLHMLWGLFMTILLVLLQCLIFGFFIGSGKTIKRVVGEEALSAEWIQKTKDYKNKCYPALMLAILVTASAGIVGGGVSIGAIPVWIHEVLVWAALFLNVRSLWVSYKVVVENVSAIHKINREIHDKPRLGSSEAQAPGSFEKETPRTPLPAYRLFYFFAAAVWVPYLYMKISLGSRTFPFLPFAVLSLICLLLGWRGARKVSKT